MLRDRIEYNNLKYFLCFVGYPYSGHSLVGSVLDAHPHMMISHELDVLGRLHKSRLELFDAIIANSCAHRAARRQSGYDYTIAGQGSCVGLEVIGDKKGGYTTLRLADGDTPLEALGDLVALPLKLVHVVRNPFDTIAAYQSRKQCGISRAIWFYNRLCAINARLRDHWDVFDVILDALVADPKRMLVELCEFVGQCATAEFLDTACGVVDGVRHREWRWPEYTNKVRKLIESYPFTEAWIEYEP